MNLKGFVYICMSLKLFILYVNAVDNANVQKCVYHFFVLIPIVMVVIEMNRIRMFFPDIIGLLDTLRGTDFMRSLTITSAEVS